MSNISAASFKKLYLCPKNPVHELSTNFSGDIVCVNCKKQIEELKKEVQSASSRTTF
jgi:hypothetical protein